MRDVFVHPEALVESKEIGDGTRVWAFAHVMAGAAVGSDCNIGGGSFLESGVRIGDRVTVKNNCLLWVGVVIGDDVFLGPNVVFTNDLIPRPLNKTPEEEWLPTSVESGVTIGANATIVCGVRLGAHSLIGAGAVVTRSVRSHEVVVGNPACHSGWICSCGGRVEKLTCEACERAFEVTDHGLV